MTALVRTIKEIAQKCYDSLSYPSRKHYPSVRSEIEFLRSLQDSQPKANSVSVDLGCGIKAKNPFKGSKVIGIDIKDSPGVVKADLVLSGIPLAEGSIDYVTAYDFIEHIPRYIAIGSSIGMNPFIRLMNEVYRVLKPGGLFLSNTPAFPSKSAFQDPTHVNIITEDTFPVYFCSCKSRAQPFAHVYGFEGEFELVKQAWLGNDKLLTLLAKNI